MSDCIQPNTHVQVTEAGTVIVSGVVASCYVHEQRTPIMQWAATLGNNWVNVFGVRTDGRTPIIWQAMQVLQTYF
jgi:hypothetical protein